MTNVDERRFDQAEMWNRWHFRHIAVDESSLHLACREDLLRHLPAPSDSGPVLELGSGQGFDALSIGRAGYKVEALDFSSVAVEMAVRQLADYSELRVRYFCRNISLPLPYEDETFTGIYSYLALHYFDAATTRDVFREVARVASRGCVLSFAVRSTEDPLFGVGSRLGEHYYISEGHIRHFFDLDELASVLRDAWTIIEVTPRRAHYLSSVGPPGGIIKVLALRN